MFAHPPTIDASACAHRTLAGIAEGACADVTAVGSHGHADIAGAALGSGGAVTVIGA